MHIDPQVCTRHAVAFLLRCLLNVRCSVACSAFDRLKEVRQLEYELDFAQNRAARDKAALKERLAAALAASQKLQVGARSQSLYATLILQLHALLRPRNFQHSNGVTRAAQVGHAVSEVCVLRRSSSRRMTLPRRRSWRCKAERLRALSGCNGATRRILHNYARTSGLLAQRLWGVPATQQQYCTATVGLQGWQPCML